MRHIVLGIFLVTGLVWSVITHASDVNVDISVTNATDTQTTINVQPDCDDQPIQETDCDPETLCTDYVPYVVGGILYVPKLDVFDEAHGIWLRYSGQVAFTDTGCIDFENTDLRLESIVTQR